MGRPPSDLDDYLDWQQHVEGQKTSGLSMDEFCAREGLTRSSFYHWMRRLREGIPEAVACRCVERWYRSGTNLDHAISALSVYLGHAKVTDTYPKPSPCAAEIYISARVRTFTSTARDGKNAAFHFGRPRSAY